MCCASWAGLEVCTCPRPCQLQRPAPASPGCGAGELAWLMLGLLTAALYAVAWTSPAISPLRLLQFQLLPALGALACRYRHETYLR